MLWEAQWSLLLPSAAQQWETEGDVFDLVVDEGVHEAIDTLAAHYLNIVPDSGGATVVVSVSGVHDFTGYARTMQYLESLNEVDSVDVLAVVSGRLRLGLKLRTGVAGLRELVALGSTLAEDIGDVDGALALPPAAVTRCGNRSPGTPATASGDDAAQLPLQLAVSGGRRFANFEIAPGNAELVDARAANCRGAGARTGADRWRRRLGEIPSVGGRLRSGKRWRRYSGIRADARVAVPARRRG